MSTVDAQIIIVGGGLGGLTLACICKRLSITCKVLERSETLQPVGAGISLAPNALAMLDQLGLYNRVLEDGQKLTKVAIHRNNTLWNTLDWTQCEKTFGYPVLKIERHHFHRLLYAAAGGDETVTLGAKVEDIVDDPIQPTVKVVLDSGRELTANVVIGADGVRSVTRRILAGKPKDKSANTIRFTGRVHMSGITTPLENLDSSDLGTGHWMLYDDCILTTWPCPDNRQWFIGVKKADTTPQRDRSVWASTTPEMIKDVYGEKFHPFAEHGKFAEIVDHSERILASNVFEEVEFPSMSKGRVALVGDAAHGMTSFFGQGACQAIEDAAVLGNLLAKAFNTVDISDPKIAEKMLSDYSDERCERVRQLVQFSSGYAKIHTASLPCGLGPIVRKIVYSYVPTSWWMWYLKWLYGVQPIVTSLPIPRGDIVEAYKD